MDKPLKLYKLIILYILNRVDFPLTNAQISEFILEEGYTTYFKLQQAISELVEANLIREESTHNRTFFHITEEGTEIVYYFHNDISPAIQQDINAFLKKKKYELKNEVSVKSDYYWNPNGEYSVKCQVIEQRIPLIDLTVTAPTEAEAETIAHNWTKKNQEIYALIMSKLL